MLDDAVRHAQTFRTGRPSERLSLFNRLVERIELGAERILIRTSTARVAAVFNLEADPNLKSKCIELACASTKVWHGRQLRLVIPGPDAGTQLRHRDQKLINWFARLMQPGN